MLGRERGAFSGLVWFRCMMHATQSDDGSLRNIHVAKQLQTDAPSRTRNLQQTQVAALARTGHLRKLKGCSGAQHTRA